jgi:hypothetical protein
MFSGIEGTRITESYARMVARDLYFCAWPMVNIYNRRLAFSQFHWRYCSEPQLACNKTLVKPYGMVFCTQAKRKTVSNHP